MNEDVDHDLHLSRRDARARRESIEQRTAEGDGGAPEAQVPKRRKRRTWIWGVSILAVLVVALVLGGIAAKRLYDQAMGVRAELTSAIADVREVQRAVLSVDTDAAAAAATRLQTKTLAAVHGSSGRLWTLAAGVPFVGDDLAAVRQVAITTDNIARDVVAPVTELRLDAFRPVEGRISLEAISGLSTLIDRVDNGVTAAAASLKGIDRAGLIDQVADGVIQLEDALAEVQPMIGPVRDVLSVLPHGLGADGPRDYLLMFQGISEARSLGGNAAIFIVLRAENGGLSIVDEVASQDFRNATPNSIVDLDPQAEVIYGDKIGRYTADFTMVPDFPDAVRILNAWWQREGFTPYEAVMSFDPVALSYLLAATGPVALPTGDVLTAENAASLLLNEVYFKYSDPLEQNVFFAGAASAVFSTITSGNFSPIAFMNALTKAADESRLLYWSPDAHEMELIAGSRMAGVLPKDNVKSTVLGAYVNDNTTSKKSYYLDMSLDMCRSGTSVTNAVTLASSITADQAANFPLYMTGRYFEPGDISTFLVLYGPVGTTLTSVTLNGVPAPILSAGEHLGRPAVKVDVFTHLQETHTIVATFDGVAEDAGPLEAWHTPMVRDTRVAVSETCK